MARTGLKYVAKNLEKKNLRSYLPRKNSRTFCYLLIIYWIIHITFVNILRNQKFGALHAHSSSSYGELGSPSSLAGSKVFYQIFFPFSFLSIRFFAYQIFCHLFQVLGIFPLDIFCSRYIFIRSFSLGILLYNKKKE